MNKNMPKIKEDFALKTSHHGQKPGGLFPRAARCLAVFVFFVSTCGCVTPRQRIPDAGRLEGRVYHNDYFKFSIRVPEGAEIQGDAEREQMMKEGLSMAFPGQAIEQPETGKMLTFSMDPSEPAVNDDFFLAYAAIKPSPTEHFEGPSELINAVITTMRESALKISTMTPVYQLQVGGISFAGQDLEVADSSGTIMETLLGTLRQGHVFYILASYSEPAGKKRALAVLETARFK